MNLFVGLPGERALLLLVEPALFLCRQGFAQFVRMEAIQRTEIFEYCQRLRQPESFLLPFQVVEIHKHIWCSSSDLPQNMHPSL